MDTKQGSVVFSTADLRKNLGEVLALAHYQGQVVDISSHGKPYAAIVSHEDAEFIKTLKEASGGSLEEWKRRFSEFTENGKELSELVPEIERDAEATSGQPLESISDPEQAKAEPRKSSTTRTTARRGSLAAA